MTLALAIETSSADYGAAVFDGDGRVVACRTLHRDDPEFAGIGAIVACCMRTAGRAFSELDRVLLDVGPGNLGSVRAGIAYANGLAYSLSKKIMCVNSLELLAFRAFELGHSRVLCLRNAGSGNAYGGLFQPLAPPLLRHGVLDTVVTSLAGSSETAVAGVFRQRAVELAGALDTGLESPDAQTLVRFWTARGVGAFLPVEVASPVTEESAMFYPFGAITSSLSDDA